MRPRKLLTSWEMGQELIRIVDTIDEALGEIEEPFPEVAGVLKMYANDLSRLFNRLGTHEFDLRTDRKV